MARSPIILATSRALTTRRASLPSAGMIAVSFVFVLIGLVSGVLLSLDWQEKNGLLQQPVTRTSDKRIIEDTILKLEAEQVQLKHSLTDARARLDSLKSTSTRGEDQLDDIKGEIGAAQVKAGLVVLEGPGVIASYQDSNATIPDGEDPANYILHDYNLRDVLNTLWASGAEAISVNEERVLVTTALYCVGPTVICNATRLSPPYVIRAIGDPEKLEAGLHSSPQMEQFNMHIQIYDFPVEIRKDERVVIPAYNGAFTFKYAHPGDGVDPPTATPGLK